VTNLVFSEALSFVPGCW